MNVYNAEDIKNQVRLAQYFADRGVPVHGNRAVATWRGGTHDSVSIDEDKHCWHDHVAGKGGSIIDAYIAIEGGSVSEAIKTLGDRYHIAPISVTRAARKVTRGEMLAQDGYRLSVTYTYTDGDGKPLYYVDRYEREIMGRREKTFVQRSPTAENLDGVKRVLYNLPAVRRAQRVFIVEGEKDVETMRRMNLVATTNSGGGKFWQRDFNAEFEGKDVVVIPDNDEVGESHAASLVAQLRPIAKSVKCVKVSALHKGDVTDYMEREGGSLASLLEMVDAAPLACVSEDADVARAKEMNAEPLRNWEWGEPRVVHGKNGDRTVTPKTPRGVNEMCAEIRERFLDFPRRLGGVLFDYTRSADPAKRCVLPILTKDALRAWTNGTSGHQSDFEPGGNFAGWSEIYERLLQTVPQYSGVANAPWYPPREDIFPVHPILPAADPTHTRFWEFVGRFLPATPADRTLLAAFMLAPMFYSRAGSRPAWAIDTVDAQGSGKTKVAMMCAALYGEEPIGLDLKSLNNDVNEVRKRLLSSSGRAKRIALFDNLTESFKGANLADLVTESSISGRPSYGRGEETRVNDVTWVATMNGGTVDTDMATRTYKLKIRKPPRYDPHWERETLAFIDAHRMQILADGIHMMETAPERVRHDSRFAMFDATVVSAVCATDAEFDEVSQLIRERAQESNEDIGYAAELADLIVRFMARWDRRSRPEGETGPEPGNAWVLRTSEMDAILRTSSGAIRGWTSRRVRRLVMEGNAPHFARDFDRINNGAWRQITGQARAFCFFPSPDIPRRGKVPAQLIQIDCGVPVAVATGEISL